MTYGLLAPEQAKQFYVQIYDQVPWSKLHRKERKTRQDRRARQDRHRHPAAAGQDRRPVGDDGYRVTPTFGRVPYTCVRLKLPWEVSEETFNDNIEGEALEDKLMGMLTTQLGLDLEDLHWNGDTADRPGRGPRLPGPQRRLVEAARRRRPRRRRRAHQRRRHLQGALLRRLQGAAGQVPPHRPGGLGHEPGHQDRLGGVGLQPGHRRR